MNYLSIGKLDRVSALCLGGGSFGSQIGEERSNELLDCFFEAGGNFVDTAHVYGAWDPKGSNGGCGNSEVAIGRWMRSRKCRDKVVVGTKGGHPDFTTGESRLSREWIATQLQESLEHLDTDYIDIYFLHRDDRSIPVAEILDWLKEPVEAGQIRELACSNWRADRLLEARAVAKRTGLPLLAANQISWSLAHANKTLVSNRFGEQVAMDDETWEIHRREGIPMTAYQSQAGGLFAACANCEESEYEKPDFPKANMVRKFGNDLTWRRVRAAKAMASEKGCRAHHIALAWMLGQPFAAFPLIGASNVEQLRDSLRALEIALTPEEFERLRKGA